MSLSNKINELLDHPTSTENQLLSIRIQSSIVNQVDELASELDKTRSDLINAYISGGIEETVMQLDQRKKPENNVARTGDDKSDVRYFLLNTNYNNTPSDHFLMLKKGEAAAFYSGWKENIKDLREGDIIFLYYSGHGICGYGSADRKLNITDHEGNKNEKYSRLLNDFTSDFKPITAKTCKDITKSNFNFRITMSRLTKQQGEIFVKKINELINA